MNTDPEEDFIKEVEAEYNTAGHKKFLRYFEELVKTQPFQKEIFCIRKKYGVPTNGFKSSKKVDLPENWVFRFSKRRREFEIEIKKLCQKNHLHYMDSIILLKPYILYNELDLENIIYERGVFNLLHISDLAEESKEPSSRSFQESDNMAYPIAVRISPYASLRDILDFIKKVYKNSILPLQNHYKIEGVRIGKSKKKKAFIQERNKIIYQNRHLPSKTIMEILYKKYGFNFEIDQGYIGKIISIEKKRRKEP